MCTVYAIIRFAQCDDELLTALHNVAEYWRQQPGNEAVEVLHNVDEPDLVALISRWQDVGSYRRGFSGYDAKLLLTPVMLRAVDEPSVYVAHEEL